MGFSGFAQYGDAAGNIADQYGISRPVFFGLIQQESSWNPFAQAKGSSAFGFTQLLKGTASDLGVNAHDPIQNLEGGASYFSSLLNKFGGDYKTALAAYHDGPGAVGQHGGFQYAQDVLDKAQGYLAKGAASLGLGSEFGAAVNSATGGITNGVGITGNCDWLCEFEKWIKDSGFFQRLALAVLAFIILFAGFALMKGESFASTATNVLKGN